MTNELRQPLRRRGVRERLKALSPSPLKAATMAAVLAAGTLTLWLVRTGDPMIAEPVVHIKLDQSDPITTATAKKPAEDVSEPLPAQDVIEADELEAARTEAAIIQVSKKRLDPAPFKSVSERTPFGVLPRIAKNGRKPFDAYSRPVRQSVLNTEKPVIAVMIGGMGLNAGLTRQAIDQLPGEITFAFAPYGKKLQRQINRARAGGHEIILQLPMEPFGYPEFNPGPKTLLTSAKPGELTSNLKWHLGRFAGYIGVTNYLGARFTADGEALAPVLHEVKNRGLVYLDDGTSSRSMAPALGQVIGVGVKTALRVIDSDADFNAISAALSELENQARKTGSAMGSGTGLAITIDAVQSWARELSDRDILLVPVSALFKAKTG